MSENNITKVEYDQPIVFDTNKEVIKQHADEAKSIVLLNWEDEENYKIAKKKRTEINKLLKAIHERKRAIKTGAEDWLKKVEAHAKDLQNPLTQAEAHLAKQITIRDAELARQKAEQEAAEKRETERRMSLALSIGWQKPVFVIQAMSHEDFEKEFAEAKSIHDANKEREKENERLRREYEEKQRAEMDELKRQNRELQRQATDTVHEKMDLAKEEAELARQKAKQAEAEAEEAKRKLAEKEKEEEDARIAKAEQEAKEKARKAEEEKAALEKAKIDKATFDAIKAEFPTLAGAWAEIAKLRKELEAYAF